jgi:hypothetical protein
MGVRLQKVSGKSYPGANPRGQCGRNTLKKLAFIGVVVLLGGCASRQGTAFDRQMLLELEEKNVRLEAEVTRLREETLKAEERGKCSAAQAAKSEGDSEPRLQAPPPHLPEVRMTPSASSNELPAGAAVIRPAADLPEEEEVDPNTRPVLKVRGQHEAWVYHRPLTDDDRTTEGSGLTVLP